MKRVFSFICAFYLSSSIRLRVFLFSYLFSHSHLVAFVYLLPLLSFLSFFLSLCSATYQCHSEFSLNVLCWWSSIAHTRIHINSFCLIVARRRFRFSTGDKILACYNIHLISCLHFPAITMSLNLFLAAAVCECFALLRFAAFVSVYFSICLACMQIFFFRFQLVSE